MRFMLGAFASVLACHQACLMRVVARVKASGGDVRETERVRSERTENSPTSRSVLLICLIGELSAC